jgi:hypothetical protein
MHVFLVVLYIGASAVNPPSLVSDQYFQGRSEQLCPPPPPPPPPPQHFSPTQKKNCSNIILINLLDSDWSETVPIKY